jgi:hypothetical protein
VRLDRDLQRQILERLADSYPNSLDLSGLEVATRGDFQRNLHYLHEHRLVEATRWADQSPEFVMARITASGMDFLQGDGGLEALRHARPDAPKAGQ